MRKLFAAIFVVALLLAASFATVAGATKEDHPPGGWGQGGVGEKENCGPKGEDVPFFTEVGPTSDGTSMQVFHDCAPGTPG
jgi:hypothetical protein